MCTVLENKVSNLLDLDACLKAKQKDQGAEACGRTESYLCIFEKQCHNGVVLVLKIFLRKAWSRKSADFKR